MAERRYTPTDLTRLERQMERRWHDLAVAEQRGQPIHVLERMYDGYLAALDDYIRCQRALGERQRPDRLAS
jgi:hypothetical protein